MYIRTLPSIQFGEPKDPPAAPLQKTFISDAITFLNAAAQLKITPCGLFVPGALHRQPKIDVLFFFHGLDSCKPHYESDPQKIITNFKLADQVNSSARKAALVVPLVDFNPKDRAQGFIRAAWSAAYINALVEEVLTEVGKWSGVKPVLDRLILAGHSAGYEILIPLADQFIVGHPETRKGALAKLSKVLALDIPHHRVHVDSLIGWASSRSSVEVTLAFAKWGDPPTVWKNWQTRNPKATLPSNLRVLNLTESHCELPGKYIQLLL